MSQCGSSRDGNGPQMTASEDMGTSVLQSQGSEFCQQHR